MGTQETKIEYIQKWFIKADNDMQSAVTLRSAALEDITTDTICFHCQQTIEKYLKAFLIWHNVEFDKIHDLVYLQKLCSTIDIDISSVPVKALNFFGIMVRYPDNFYIPSLDEADHAISLAKQIKVLIRSKLDSL